MENTKPKINVKRFSRSKVDLEDKPIEEPVVEKKTRGRKKKVIIEEPTVEEPIIEEPIVEEVKEEEEEEEYIPESFDEDFLQELNASNYQKQREEEDNREANLKQQKEQGKERIKAQKEQEKYLQQLEKEKVRNNKAKVNSDSDLYSDEGTEIRGKDKLILLHKIKQYKTLFSEELKTFKIKPNASITELKQYIDDIDVIVSTSDVDQFLTDSILQCIKLLEIPTSRTKNYNITGLADLLKANKQFHQLCKKLYLKYGCFEAVPPEAQLVILVATTAWVCKNKNSNKDSLEAYLNQPVELK
jgi:hypothetical protein